MKKSEVEGYVESLKGHTDRELLERQLYYTRKTADHAKSINGYLFVICILFVLIFVTMLIIGVGITSASQPQY